MEDQGWLAHFVIAVQTGRPIAIYGNGKQVRDMLYVDDLVRAYLLAVERIDSTAGKIYNVGGGPDNTLSIPLRTTSAISELPTSARATVAAGKGGRSIFRSRGTPK